MTRQARQAGGDVISDQDVDPLAEDRAPDRLVLALAAGNADGTVDAAELLERDPDHAPVEVGLDWAAGRVEKAQADVADRTLAAESE